MPALGTLGRAVGLTVLVLRSGLCAGVQTIGFASSLDLGANRARFIVRCGRLGAAWRGTAGWKSLAAASGGSRPKGISLDRMLQQQGFGTRKLCKSLVKEGYVTVMGRAALDPNEVIAPEAGMAYTVDGVEWEFHNPCYILLNKPPGYECSAKPSAWPSILDLLPGPFRDRGVQSVGRLDVDTTGLLLLTDDGKFSHHITSPKRNKPKIYHVTTKHPLSEGDTARILQGVMLKDEPVIVRACLSVQVHELMFRTDSLLCSDSMFHVLPFRPLFLHASPPPVKHACSQPGPRSPKTLPSPSLRGAFLG